MSPVHDTIRRRQSGFTLVELVMVIVIMGVIGGIVTVFLKSPIDAYIASGRRAALSDAADTVVRRIARDLRRSLPNSIRTSGTNCIEFIPVKTGGRYRVEEKVAGDDSSLDFSKSDTTFNMLGVNNALPLAQRVAANDLIVVYNLGIVDANAYNADNTAMVASVSADSGAETPISLATGKKFPLASGSNRFHVVAAAEQQVAYVCSNNNLYRAVASAPTIAASCVPGGAILASNVNCSQTTFSYAGSDLARNALVSMVLSIRDSSLTETVTLQHEVHVSNTP